MDLGAFELVDDAVVAIDTRGKVTYANRPAQKLYSPEADCAGVDFAQLVGVEGCDYSSSDLSFADREPVRVACRHVLPDGAQHHVDWTVRFVPDATSPFYLSVARPQAVDDRVRLQGFIEALPDAALFVDAEGRVVVINQRLAAALGSTPAELEGADALSQFPADLAATRKKHFDGLSRERRAVRFEDARGDRHFLNTLTPVFDRAGTFAGAAIIAVDVTDLKREHASRLELEERVARAARLEALGRLAGGVAHDFNNMLTGVLGFVELSLLDLEPEHPVVENLTSIKEAVEHAADLTRRLLAFSRRQVIKPKYVDLNQLMESTIGLLTRVLGEDIELRFEPNDVEAIVHMDPAQVNQVLMNLATNARDAMPGGGVLAVNIHSVPMTPALARKHSELQGDRFVCLEMTDSGVGMAPEALAKVFEPFFTTKSRDRGTGLGLPTVHGIVRQNGGAVEVSSRPNAGTQVRVYLPQSEAPQESKGAAPAAISPKSVSSSTILLVEDEARVREVTRRILESTGYDVLAAATGEEAIRLHEKAGKVAALLTDVIMPDMNGKELMLKIRELQPDVECVFMSGYTDDVIAQHGVLEPGVNFVEKPFSTAALVDKLQQVLRA